MEFISFPKMLAFNFVLMVLISTIVCSYGSNAHRGRKDSMRSTENREKNEVKCGMRPYDNANIMNPRLKKRSIEVDFIENSRQSTTAGIENIVGGNDAIHGEYPWQARVSKILERSIDGSISETHDCGAVIISEYWLLSAAHCFVRFQPSDFRIYVGDLHLNETDADEQVFDVDVLITHENYDNKPRDNDIALIKIRPIKGRGIQFGNYVQPACIVDPADPYIAGTKCMISGWGTTSPYSSEASPILKGAEVPLVRQEKCIELYKRYFISDRMFCAGYPEGGVDACKMDSGGPLACKINGVYKVVGIISWGFGCADRNFPGVYVRVSSFVPWINSNIKLFSNNTEQRFIPSN